MFVVEFCSKVLKRTIKTVIRESWGRTRRFRGSVAAFGNSEKNEYLSFEIFVELKGGCPIAKSIRILIWGVQDFVKKELPDHFDNRLVFKGFT